MKNKNCSDSHNFRICFAKYLGTVIKQQSTFVIIHLFTAKNIMHIAELNNFLMDKQKVLSEM